MKAKRVERTVSLAFALFGLWYLAIVSQYPPAARLLPTIAGSVFLSMIVLQLVGDGVRVVGGLVREKEGGEGETGVPTASARPGGTGRFLVIAGWTVVSLGLIWAFGLTIGIALSVFLFEGFIDRSSWPLAGLLSAATFGFVYAMMVLLLNLPPFTGFVFDLLQR